jgi:SAM-dependent methyltransferase
MGAGGIEIGNTPAGPPAGADYDALPYLSMPLAWAQPARLAAMAVLHGLDPPAAERARVLELGCASGGHIIPLAARFPAARFTGIDLARRHVEDAARRIAALGLTNVAVHQGDIADADFAGERFDIIVCHGVLSWVPRPVQEAIFRICRDHLADRGLAVVSYNVLPGWHQRRIVRDICLDHAGKEGTPREKVARVRRILKELSAAANPADPYGHLLSAEAERLATVPGSYILGEFLSTHNEPLSFRDFLARARAFGLGYVSECDLPSSCPEGLAPAAAKRIRALAGADALLVQHLTDVFSGRPFRRSILVPEEQARGTLPAPRAERLPFLHMAACLRLDEVRSQPGAAVFVDQQRRTVTIRDEAVRDAVVRLGASYPATAPVAELVAEARDRGARQRVLRALLRLVETGRATLSTMPLAVGRASDAHPIVWPVARAEAAGGEQPWVTSLAHAPVLLNPVLRFLVPLIDGSRDRAELAVLLAEALGRGEVQAPEVRADAASADPARLGAKAEDLVSRGLEYLAVNGVLEP